MFFFLFFDDEMLFWVIHAEETIRQAIGTANVSKNFKGKTQTSYQVAQKIPESSLTNTFTWGRFTNASTQGQGRLRPHSVEGLIA